MSASRRVEPRSAGAPGNPFVIYRHRLDSYRKAAAAGWSDSRFVAEVEALDEAVASVDGHGFRVTPLAESPAIARALGVGRCWLKDETGNVAGSHKARHLFGVALHLRIAGDRGTELAIASCGNAAIAAAVVARALDRPLAVYIPTWAGEATRSALVSLGARVVTCERRPGESGDPAYLRFVEAVDAGAVPFSCQSTMTPTTLDGGRTLGWELADQLIREAVEGPLQAYVQVGGGALASAMWAGLRTGLAGEPALAPVLRPVQTVAAAPLRRAWDRLGQDAGGGRTRLSLAQSTPERYMTPWEDVGESAASGILDDVTYDWLPIVAATEESNGAPVVVEEADVVGAHRMVRAETAIDADPTGTSGLAGALRDRRSGDIDAGAQVLALVTGITRR